MKLVMAGKLTTTIEAFAAFVAIAKNIRSGPQAVSSTVNGFHTRSEWPINGLRMLHLN